MKLASMILQRKKELRAADPRSRDRIRHRLKVLQKVKLMRRKNFRENGSTA